MDESGRRVAVVTGGSRGLGLEIARSLADRSIDVIILSRTPPPQDFPAEHIQADLSDAVSVLSAFERIREQTNHIEILINNAAALQSQYLMIMPIDSILAMVNTNLTGSILVAREAIKLMRKRGFGRLIHISSMATVLKPMGDSTYAATKAGLEVFSAILAKEVSSLGITSNILSVSAFDSDMYRSLNQERVGKVVNALPVPGFVSVDEVMNVIDFFLSDTSGGITGQSLRLGGVS